MAAFFHAPFRIIVKFNVIVRYLFLLAVAGKLVKLIRL